MRYKNDSSWSQIPSTVQPRYLASSVLDKNENLWMLGGGTKDPRGFDSTEFYQYRPGEALGIDPEAGPINKFRHKI